MTAQIFSLANKLRSLDQLLSAGLISRAEYARDLSQLCEDAQPQLTPLGEIIAARIEVPAGAWLRTSLDLPRPTGRDEVWLQVNSTALFSVLAFVGADALVRRLDKGPEQNGGRAFWRPAAGLQRTPSPDIATTNNRALSGATSP
jgi:hypothetical protein